MTRPTLRRRLWLLLALATLLAAVLQVSRLPFRWNQITFAYGAYYGEYLWSVGLRGWPTAFTTFVGIHPPAYSLLAAGLITVGAAAGVWHAISGLFSVAAVPALGAAVARGLGRDVRPAALVVAGGAAFLLASSPHRNAYGLEVNNYPLLILATCLQMLAFARFAGDRGTNNTTGGSGPPGPAGSADRRGPALALALCTALALWTHALAAALPLAQVAALGLTGRRNALRRYSLVLAFAAALCLPLVPGVLDAMGGDPINREAGLGRALKGLFVTLPTRYGWATAAWAVVGLSVLGMRRVLALPKAEQAVPLSWALHAAIAGGLVLALSALGIASPWQFPYYLGPLPSLLALAACALLPQPTEGGDGPTEPAPPDVSNPAGARATSRRIRPVLGVFAALVVVHSVVQGAEFLDAQAVRSRAADVYGLVAEGVEDWRPGDTLLLVQFPRYLDDDKDAVDPIYPLLPLWTGFRYVDPGVPGLLPYDPYWGQPVRFADGRWLYTLTSAEPDRLEAITAHVLAAGHRVIVAAYATDRSPDGTQALTDWAQGRSRTGRKGPDHLLWVFEPN